MSEKDEQGLLAEAALQVAIQYSRQCRLCHPEACSNHSKRYYRLDDAAPDILAATTHELPIIPQVHRIPVETLLQQDDPHSTNLFFNDSQSYRQFLFEYNPSIVALPFNYSTTNDTNQDRPVYLASYRVSTLSHCLDRNATDALYKRLGGSAFANWTQHQVKRDYLGLALLRSDLSILQQGVYHFNAQVRGRFFEDARLYQQQGKLYLTMTNHIFPLWIGTPPSDDSGDYLILKPLFPSTMPQVTIRRKSTCTINRGKNILFVWDGNRTISENSPMGRKEVIDLTIPCELAPKEPIHLSNDPELPAASFATWDTYHFQQHNIRTANLFTTERGSFCCVDLHQVPSFSKNATLKRRHLWLGISHSKTRFRSRKSRHDVGGGVSSNAFRSQFYLMEPYEPFRVVARSGHFCLGFSSPEEDHRYAKLPFQDSLRFGETTMDCPRIHFVSGMIEDATDPSRLILAYGINDCVARFVQISKQSVFQLLFPTHV